MKILFGSFALLIIILQFNLYAQTVKPTTKIEKELTQFFDGYADDLRQHRRQAIVGRYDERGAYLMGQGKKTFSSFAEIRTRYMEKWKGPKAFAFKEMTYEELSSNSAYALGKFEWTTENDRVINCSYTGILNRKGGKWFIRVEDESCQPG